MQIALILFFGLLTGVMSGLLGIGGGTIMVPVFVYFFKMNMHQAIGTSLAIMVPIALVGAARHYLGGVVDLKNVLFFVIMALVGGWLGATLAQHLPAVALRKIFAVFLVIISIQMFFKD